MCYPDLRDCFEEALRPPPVLALVVLVVLKHGADSRRVEGQFKESSESGFQKLLNSKKSNIEQ